jgi:hypothetical protein
MFYTLMHKKIPVADISMDEKFGFITKINRVFNINHFPVGTVLRGTLDRDGLNEWWRNRSIPASRPGLREAIETLGVLNEKELLARSLGLSLSDQYWIRPKDGGVTWEKVNFFENDFSTDVGDILFTGRRSGPKENIDLISPDNTSDGWLRKRWVIRNGERKLTKAGSPPFYQEPCNEVFASALCGRLGIRHVEYKLVPGKRHPACICADFIDTDTELVSAWYIYRAAPKEKDISLYNHLTGCCEKAGLSISGHFDRMITLDYLIANTDRHLNNFGVIRNAETLEWTGPAPIYDSGTSLWHDADTDMIKPSYKIKSKPFRNNHNDQIKLVKDFSWLDPASLHAVDEEFEAILTNSVFIRKERRDVLCGAVKTRVKNLREIARGRPPKHPPASDYGREM